MNTVHAKEILIPSLISRISSYSAQISFTISNSRPLYSMSYNRPLSRVEASKELFFLANDMVTKTIPEL